MSGRNPSGPKYLIVVGAGGLGAEYVWVAESMNAAASQVGAKNLPWKLLGYADDDPQKRGQRVGNHTVQGNIDESSQQFLGQESYFVVAVGNNCARARLAADAMKAGWRPATLIHPSVVVASHVLIGPGCYIAPGCVICPNARIGEHVIINTHATIGHDSVLDDFVQVCPGARISGGCHLESYAFVGSNASLGPGVCVGAGAVVGANSHALWRVSSGRTVIGNPAVPAGALRTPGKAHEL